MAWASLGHLSKASFLNRGPVAHQGPRPNLFRRRKFGIEATRPRPEGKRFVSGGPGGGHCPNKRTLGLCPETKVDQRCQETTVVKTSYRPPPLLGGGQGRGRHVERCQETIQVSTSGKKNGVSTATVKGCKSQRKRLGTSTQPERSRRTPIGGLRAGSCPPSHNGDQSLVECRRAERD